MDNRKINFVILLLLIFSSFLPISIYADTVILKSGEKIEGTIIEKTKKHIKIYLYDKSVIYSIGEIESIKGITDEASLHLKKAGIHNR